MIYKYNYYEKTGNSFNKVEVDRDSSGNPFKTYDAARSAMVKQINAKIASHGKQQPYIS